MTDETPDFDISKFSGKRGRVEPTADIRQFAIFLRQAYVALVDQGFSPRETLTIIGHMIMANASSSGDSEEK
jgi:hypothetical protein